MFRTIKIRLERTNDLVETVRTFNKSCQIVLDYGFDNHERNKTHLNRATYHEIRKQYPNLPSALVQTSRDQCADMMKRDKFKHKIKKKELSSIRYDKRTLSVFLESGYLTLSTIFGRMKHTFKLDKYSEKYVKWKVQNAQLTVSNNYCWLNLQMEADTPETIEGDRRLGIDRGINNIAVCSDNTFYNSKLLKKQKSEYQYLKTKLQSIGTRSAKRKLKKIAGRERRFVKDLNHCLAKDIVSKPFDIFVFEELNIKTKKSNGKQFNKKLGNWSFAQLQLFVKYKAENIGKTVITVNPKYTSQMCSKCGHIEKTNRNGSRFNCKKCGFQLNADLNASRNISVLSRSSNGRLCVNQPIVSSEKIDTSPPSLEVGH